MPKTKSIREQLRSACQLKDYNLVRQLLDNPSATAADATACLQDSYKDLSLVRILLEHGADPAVCAQIRYMRGSIELVKLLVEFGYDVSINGHCILQYASTYESLRIRTDCDRGITPTPRSPLTGCSITVSTSTAPMKSALTEAAIF